MRDLSEHGFSLRAMMPLRQSEKVPFSFALDAAARIDGEAIVVRIDDGGHVAALEFAGLPLHSRDQIHRWLDRFDEPISPETASAQLMPSKHVSLTELRSQIRAPKAPSPASSAAESASPPPPAKETVPPKPEPVAMPPSPVAELSTAPPKAVAPPMPEPPVASITPAVENSPPPPMITAPPKPEPPLPSVSETPQSPPLQTVMVLPRPSSPPPQEAPPPPPPKSYPTFEQLETPALPPLLKLSSVRPGPLPAETPVEPAAPAAISKSVEEPPAKIPLSLPKPVPPAPMETRIPEPLPAPPVAPRRVPPALEPLSSLEGETDSDSPGWMDRFTLGRAIGIMLFLAMFASAYVYHREVGQTLIWLGHQIAGDDSPENSKVVRPAVPPAPHATPQPTPPASAIPPPPLTVQESPDTSGPKSANLPAAASDKTPSPQLKDATQGSLVPLTQITRPPASAPPADNSVEAGQQEHLEALQILRSPSRVSEVPAAIQLLWVAMEKGNTGAEIDLAELFRTGRGVAKNCDQARVLLSAAARKGSAEARKRLEAFRREGCSN